MGSIEPGEVVALVGPSGAGNLTRITFPDTRTRVYLYGESAQVNGGSTCSTPSLALPNVLTGRQDEKGVRLATYAYDCSARVTSTEHAGGVERYEISYSATERTVVDPLGTSRTVGVPAARILGVAYSTGTTQPAASGPSTSVTQLPARAERARAASSESASTAVTAPTSRAADVAMGPGDEKNF